MILPRIKPFLGILRFSMFIDSILLLYQLVNNVILCLFDVLQQFLVIPTCFLLQIGHYKQNTVNESVTGAFLLSQFTENLLLNSTDNRDIRSLDEDGTLGIFTVNQADNSSVHKHNPCLFCAWIRLNPSGVTSEIKKRLRIGSCGNCS